MMPEIMEIGHDVKNIFLLYYLKKVNYYFVPISMLFLLLL